MIDTTTARAALLILVGTADAYGSPLLDPDRPCSRCATPCPAALPEECDDRDCPLEGRDG